MFLNYRMFNQQLIQPRFDAPEELVDWMGAVQAQDYSMAKWAVGLRLSTPSLDKVQEAIRKGTIVRTHILRPTWHFVSAQDIRWMLMISGERMKKAYHSWAKQRGMSEEVYRGVTDLFWRLLEGGRHRTKADLEQEACMERGWYTVEQFHFLLSEAEVSGTVCSGMDQAGKPTYALLEERVPRMPEISREEALTLLAEKYFRSHSPATLRDFVWWSGLTIKEARQGIGGMGNRLVTEVYGEEPYYVVPVSLPPPCDVFHFLPPYDEYLISYKNREASLSREYFSKAFNNWGIFYPVLLHNGRIVGNWERQGSLKNKRCVTLFFEEYGGAAQLLLDAENRYRVFHDKKEIGK